MINPSPEACPSCGVSRDVLLDILDHNQRWSENQAIARVIIKNCKPCQDYFWAMGHHVA